MKIYNLLMLAAVIAASSCTSDIDETQVKKGEPIVFELSTTDQADCVTRSKETLESCTTELTDSLGNHLYLHSSVTRGFDITVSQPTPDYVSDYTPEFVQPKTRGTQITAFSSSKNIAITAIDHSGSFSSSSNLGTNGFSETYAGATSITATGHYWPYDQTGSTDRKLSFFSYYPSDYSGTSGDAFARGSGYPTLTYTVPTVLASQTDLLVSRNINETRGTDGSVALAYSHAMAAVVFSFSGTIGTGSGTLTVSLNGVRSKGSYDYGTNSWTWDGSSTAAYTLMSNASVPSAGDYSSLASTGSSLVMFLMPQAFTGDGGNTSATIGISYTDAAGQAHTFTKTIGSLTERWGVGNTYRYTISTGSISSMSATYTKWTKSSANDTDGPVKKYDSADRFGLFAVYNGKIVLSNVQMKLTPTASTTDYSAQALEQVETNKAFLSDKYTYYLYYPYSSTNTNVTALSVGRTTAGDGSTALSTNPSADTFFANVTGNWSAPATTTDQSALTTFKNLDLQIAMYNSGFAMTHKMGLVMISLSTKSVPTTRNYSASGTQAADATGMKYTDSGTTTVTASSSFDASCKPYNPSSGNYWYIVRGSNSSNTYKKTFKSVTTVNTDWEYANVSVNEGNYLGITVSGNYIKRLCYKFTAVFSCTQTCQEFKLPVKGTMTMECWGASGASIPVDGNNPREHSMGGNGGYVQGTISTLDRSTMLYVYVGAQGSFGQSETINYPTFNGGGGCRGFDDYYYGTYDSDPHLSGQGGGATDIRLVKHSKGTWGYELGNIESGAQNYYEDIGTVDGSISTRLLVAGGGGGANRYAYWQEPNTHYGESEGGAAGGLIGYGGKTSACNSTRVDLATNTTGGTQTKGGDGWKYNGSYSLSNNGKFGYGGVYGTFGGGGGGYYGGGAGGSGSCVVGSGAGGSSYVSGHGGCSTLSHGGKTYTFSSPKIYDGLGYLWNSSAATSTRGFPNIAGSANENGHSGNGYAKIVLTTPTND